MLTLRIFPRDAAIDRVLTTFLAWLGATSWSMALRESVYVWPFAESLHVLTLALFAGTAAVLDLRLLGLALARVPVTALTNRMLPLTRIAFGIMVATGVLLFCATPLTYYHSLFFRLKCILLAFAAGNVFWFHARTARGIEVWSDAERPPRAARIAAVISLVAWSGVIVCGRLVAYNWFECGKQPNPAFVNWVQSCPGEAP